MSYKALYRAYRPSVFEEVAGQKHIVQTLRNALQTGKIAHAYLFAGPRGTGKTTMAKLFAKALNCDSGIGNQCNECENCVAINNGNHPDVLEIDAASNRGINEIRSLIDKVRYAPIQGKYKVYIIDEVHMLTDEAFNALLKTLEEPPEKVIFILATTEPHKILPTILSRCQRYDFTKVSDEDIKERIKIILDQEKIVYNEEAINLIINLADGGVRDALSILDQVLAYSGDTLNENDVLSIFSLESREEKVALLSSIGRKDVSDVLCRIKNYIEKGSDIKRLTNDLLKMLKDLLIFSYTNKANYFEMLNLDDAVSLLNLFNVSQISGMIDVLLNATKEYKLVSDINPLFEVTILKLLSNEIATKTNASITPKEESKPSVQIERKPILENKPIIQKPLETEEKPAEIIENTQNSNLLNSNINTLEKIVYLENTQTETGYLINQDTMIKIIVTAKREYIQIYKDGWDNLKQFSLDSTYGKYVSLLIDARLFVASHDILVVEVPTNKLADKINSKENQKYFQSLINHVFNKHVFVYAINRSDSVDYQTQFRNLKEARKLPNITDIYLKFKED